MKILVAEDEVNIAESYRLILEYKGHEVTLTYDGDKCLDVYKHSLASQGLTSLSPFDLVILDYRMPKKDGVQVAQEILRIVPAQRILLATAYVQDLSISRLHEIPATKAVELIQKPFDFDTFIQAVTNHGGYDGSSIHNLASIISKSERNETENNNSRTPEDDNRANISAFSGRPSNLPTDENNVEHALDKPDNNCGPHDALLQGESAGIPNGR